MDQFDQYLGHLADQIEKALSDRYDNKLDQLRSTLQRGGFDVQQLPATRVATTVYVAAVMTVLGGLDHPPLLSIFTALSDDSNSGVRAFQEALASLKGEELGDDDVDAEGLIWMGLPEALKKKQLERIEEVLRIKDSLDVCHTHNDNRQCKLQRPALALAAEYTREAKWLHETMNLVSSLREVHHATLEVQSLGSSDVSMQDWKWERLRATITRLERTIDDLPVNRSLDVLKGNEKAVWVLLHRADAPGPAEEVQDLWQAMDAIRTNLETYMATPSAARGKLATLANYTSHFANALARSVEKGTGVCSDRIPKCFSGAKCLPEIGMTFDRLWATLPQNTGKQPSIWFTVNTGGNK